MVRSDFEERARKPKVRSLFGRAARLKCPRCGSGGILKSWFRMKDRCPFCGLVLDRGETQDYWLGAYAINMVVGELTALIGTLIYIFATWPQMEHAVWVGVGLAVAMPALFFPFSRTFWLAWDLAFRPAEPGDAAREPAPNAKLR